MLNLYVYSFLMFILFLLMFFMSLNLLILDNSIMLEWLLLNYNSLNMEIYLLIDWISCLFISIVMIISSMIMLFSIQYMINEIYLDRFIKLVILFVFSMILMILSPNLISIMFGWDGLGLSSYCLVIFYQNYSSFNSGMVTILCNRIGDVGLLMGISLLFMYGSWNMYFFNYLFYWQYWLVMLMILLASITKSAQIPFSVWLPLAMAAPTPVSALVHSSTLVTAGVYLMIRFNKYLMMDFYMSKFLFYLSIFTMFMSGLMANLENDLKKIIALSTLSQLGLMMMILSLGFKFLAFFHLLTHAIFKSLLFMCAGIIIHLMNNNQDIRLCGKLNEFIPLTMMSFFMSKMALVGFPFMAGFYSKDLIIEMILMINNNIYLTVLILSSILFTIMYSLRLFYYIFFSEMKNNSFFIYKENKLMSYSMLLLMLLSLISGSSLMWMFFFDNYFFFLQIKIKLIVLILLFLGIFMCMFLLMINFLKYYKLFYFLNSMWFMNYLYQWIYSPFLLMGIEIYKLDKGWVEFMSKELILNLLKEMNLNFNNYKMYMFILINFIILFNVFMII